MSKPVFEDLLTFSGRRDRKSYMMFYLSLFGFGFFLGLIYLLVGNVPLPAGMADGILIALFAVLQLVAGVVTAQRCRDIGVTGWVGLLVLVPYVGWLATIAFLALPGKDGDNRFGPDPRGAGA
jgi:uncharacterized membrane protein YhaH (DUF805 family)